MAYLKTIANGRDDLAVKRIINVPKRGIGTTSLGKVQLYAMEREIGFWEALCRCESIEGLGKAASKLQSFVSMIEVLRAKARILGLKGLIEAVLETTGYIEALEEADEEDAKERIENLDELITKAAAFEESHPEAGLSEFLEEVALVADIDSLEESADRVLLMTLHSAKGLEFPHVYLAGMEDGMFPGYMAITDDDPTAIEEERRLAYVGITRAMKDLTLTTARMRMIRGETQYNPVSRFVREIPVELMDNRPTPQPKSTVSYREDSRERAVFQGTPFASVNVLPEQKFKPSARPKAVARPKTTEIHNKPFIARGTGGLTKGAPVGGKPDYVPGDRVKHIKYGAGTVVAIEPGPRDYQVTVAFDSAGQKIMYAAFAKLQKI